MQPRRPRVTPEARLLLGGIGLAVARQHPVGASLEHRQLARFRRDAWNELQRAGTVADHRDLLAAQVGVMPPARAMEGRAGKAVQPRDVRRQRTVELPGAADKDARGDGVAVTCAHLPQAGAFVVACLGDLDAEADMPEQPEALGAMLQVAVYLRLGRVRAGPVRLGREREAVEMGGDVAAAARVGVVPPGAAYRAGLLQDDKVIDAGLLEPDAHAHAGHAGADDDDLVRAGRR